MNPPGQAVVGIDVGGEKKGYHAVALRNRAFETKSSTDPAAIVNWCLERKVGFVAVDAPCGWSQSSSSRLSERELKIAGQKIHCFATPTLARAQVNGTGFYGWVFNGGRLYEELKRYYPLFDGRRREGPICFGTFPHAIVCGLAGKVVPAKPKGSTRRKILHERGYDDDRLTNIDFIDAALCAVTAEEFRIGKTVNFGTRDEGIIVVPE